MIHADTYLLRIPEYAKQKASIPQVQAFLREMGDPQDKVRVIHIAGTNGKGTICAYLTQILTEMSETTATFTSPHLVMIRERFRLNGKIVSEEDYQDAFIKVLDLTKEMEKKGFCHPTFFEFLFYMQMELIKKVKPEWLILETGMGGKRDVTNAIKNPFLTILTSISMDHMQFLGDTLEKIAAEKAGIIKEQVPVVFDALDDTVSDCIVAVAKEKRSPCLSITENEWTAVSVEYDRGSILAEIDGKNCQIPFLADYQVENAAVAYYAIKNIFERIGRRWDKTMQEKVLSAISHTKWEGRMEQVLPNVYLDGAHNKGGIHALTETIRKLYETTGKKPYLMFACAQDKEYDQMLKELCVKVPFEAVFAVHYESERALPLEELKKEMELHARCPFFLFDRVEEALENAMQSKKEDEILFCAGSLYLLGEMKSVIRRKYDD